VASDSLGTVTLGRQYDPVVDMVQGLTGDNYFGAAFATPGDIDNYENSLRVSNAVKYGSPTTQGSRLKACTRSAASLAQLVKGKRGAPQQRITVDRWVWLLATSMQAIRARLANELTGLTQ
jgi:hypothetical protein